MEVRRSTSANVPLSKFPYFHPLFLVYDRAETVCSWFFPSFRTEEQKLAADITKEQAALKATQKKLLHTELQKKKAKKQLKEALLKKLLKEAQDIEAGLEEALGIDHKSKAKTSSKSS